MHLQSRESTFSADVSQAFLRGLTFEQVAKLEGEVIRDVQFTVPPGSVPVLRTIPGYEDFNDTTEVLQMLRCGFGLKDAPRLWQKMLHDGITHLSISVLQPHRVQTHPVNEYTRPHPCEM